MKLKKQFIGNCTIILVIMLTGCASTTSHENSGKKNQQEEALITRGSVENFTMGALIAAPLAFAIPFAVLVMAG